MANLTKEVVQFANGNTDFYEAFQDYYFHYSDENYKKPLGAYDHSRSLSEKSEKINTAFLSEVERVSGVQRSGMNVENWATNPMVGWAALAVVDATINPILPQTLNTSMGLYTDIRYVSYGDVVKYKIKPRTLFTVSRGGHGERTTFRQKAYEGDFIITPMEHIVTVYTDMYRVLAGKEDIADFIRLVVLSLETDMGKEAAMALATGMQAGTYPAQLSIQGAFDAQTLITMGETVQAYNYNVRPVIAGTATALSKVVPESSLGFRGFYDAKDGSVSLMKDFYGFDLMRLPQYATGNNFGLALDPNTLYVISPALDKLVKGAVSNALTNSNQFYDNADITQNFTMRRDYDFEFVSGAWGGKYVITD